MDSTTKKFAVRETAFVLGCSTFTIYSMFKGKIEGGLTEDQLEQVIRHLSGKGIKPYKYKTAELEKVKLYLNERPEAQQHMIERRDA